MEGGALRKCASIKSRKNPGSPCTATANYGDFCFRHYKNPIRFLVAPSKVEAFTDRTFTRSHHQAVRQLQRFWRRWAALSR